MMQKISRNRVAYFNNFVDILRKKGFGFKAISTGFSCPNCGRIPDKRNLRRTFERHNTAK